MSRTFTIPISFTSDDIERASFDQLEHLADALAQNVKDSILELMKAEKRFKTYGGKVVETK